MSIAEALADYWATVVAGERPTLSFQGSKMNISVECYCMQTLSVSDCVGAKRCTDPGEQLPGPAYFAFDKHPMSKQSAESRESS